MSKIQPIEHAKPTLHSDSTPNGPQKLRHQKTINIVGSVPELNDDSLVDLELEKNLTQIDYNMMKQSIKKNHAFKPNGDPYTCKDVCYKFNTGNHYLFSSSEKSELTKFGVGIMLYFKFIKHLSVFFMLFTIISIPAFVFYISSFIQYKDSSDVSYLDLLTATTLGSVGLGATSCSVAQHPDASDVQADRIQLYFQCNSGTIADPSNIIFGMVDRGSTCTYVDERDLNTQCNLYDSTDLQTAFASCVGKPECSITVPTSLFEDHTTNSECSKMYSRNNVYFQVTCENNEIEVKGKSLSKTLISYIVTSCDAAITILFLIMIFTLKYAQKSASQHVLKKAYSASSYTVQVHNLPQSMPAEELASKLWNQLDKELMLFNGSEVKHRVIDVQIVLPNKLIELNRKMGDVVYKKNTSMRIFMQLYFPDFEGKEIDFHKLHQLMTDLKTQNHPKLREATKLYKKIKDLALKKEKFLGEIKKLKTTKDVRIVCAFVTFSTTFARNKILDMFGSTPFHRAARYICGSFYSKKNLFHGKLLRFISADDPGSILWENVGEPKVSIFGRRAFSTLLTILLWVISGAILLISTYFKNEFKNNYPEINCSNLNPTMADVANDFVRGQYQQGLIECYCSEDIVNRINEVFTTADNKKLCYIWFTDKIISQAITFAIVFIVLVINYGVQFVFQILSKFEKHPTLNKELAQRVIKTFVGQFLNTGLIILLINAKITKEMSFWQGKFRDISPLWYENVGSTLLSTMFINVFTVPALKIIFGILHSIYRCCDRRCGFDERVTRQTTQRKYEKVYTGSEFLIDARYSQVLTLTFVCFLYSSGMPFLYVTSLAQLILTYFIDKYFLLKVSKLPKNYDQKLETVVRTTLYVAVVIHLIFAIFMYGQPDILGQNFSMISSVSGSVTSISSNINAGSDNVATKFFDRLTAGPNIVLFIILVASLVLYLLKGLIYNFFKESIIGVFKKDHDFARKSNSIKLGKREFEFDDSLPFFRVLKSDDIAAMIRLTKVTIKSTQNQDLITLMKQKVELLKQEYKEKKLEEDQKRIDPNINFIGFYTYDVRLNPMYRSQFAMDELLDDENLL